MVDLAGEGEVREEFDAVWAVVRRLEAHIRRLEATVAELRSELDRTRALAPIETAEELDPVQPVAEPTDESPDAFNRDVPNGPPRYTLVFDGGAIGNPGRGYGSFQVTNARGDAIADRFDFSPAGEAITNNQAEY